MNIPHNIEAERHVLSAMLVDNEKIGDLLERGWGDGHFYNVNHQAFWQIITKLYAEAGSVDQVAVFSEVAEGDYPVTAQDIIDLPELLSTANFSQWANLIEEAALARTVAKHMLATYEAVCKMPSTAQEAIEETSSWLINLNVKRDKSLKRLNETAEDTYQWLVDMRDGKIEPGLSWGLHDMDQLMMLQPQTMNVLAARPSMGKTALALTVAYNNAIKGVSALIYSLEMSNRQMTSRLISIHGKCSTLAFQKNRSHVDSGSMARHAQSVGKLPIYIEEAKPLNIHRIRATARNMMLKANIGLIVIDYIQLVDGTSETRGREEQISEISRNTKLMSGELDLPILALAQLNREVEKRTDPTPKLSDLRDSGSIEQDADTVTFLSPTEKDADGQWTAGGKMKLTIAKHRAGPTGTVPVTFRKQFTRFENYQPQ